MLTFLPIVVYAQLDINKLQSGKRVFGLGYRQHPDFLWTFTQHNILITGDHGFTENIKGTGQVTISFLENVSDVFWFDSRYQIMHIDSLTSSGSGVGSSDYGYFLLGGIDIGYQYVSEPYQYVFFVPDYEYIEIVFSDSEFVGLGLFAGGGLYVSFGPLKPFVLYNFYHARAFEDFGGGSINGHIFSGGAHLNLSDNISLLGRAVTSHEFDEVVFEFGINFGWGKTAQQPTAVETPPPFVSDEKVEHRRVAPPLPSVTDKKPVETPPTPASYRFKKNDTLLVKVKDYLYFAKVAEDTKTSAKEVPVEFFIHEINIIAGNRVLLNAVQAKREKPKDGWGSHKVTIEYYDGTAWETVSDVFVFEDFYLLPESVPGERRIGLDKIRIPNPNY